MDLIGPTAFLRLSRADAKLVCKSAILDGEAIVQDENGVSDFEALAGAMRWRPHPIILYAFDILHIVVDDLCRQALTERRAKLKALVGTDDKSRI